MRAQAVSLLALALAAPVASAQEAASARDQEAEKEPRELERVIVTARRRDEPLQDVPLSVTAIDGKDLEMRGAEDIAAIGAATPNLTIYPARAFNGTVTAYIRGIGQFDPVWGIEPGVAIYIDDVYLARPQGALLEILDVERIEVLRGPQGTLYGKNNIGGAIKYITRRVEDDFGGNATVTVGDYNRRDAKAMLNAPIGENVRTRVAFGSFNRDGFGRNLVTGEDVSDRDVDVARAALEWRPDDFVDVRFAYDVFRDRSATKGAQRMMASRFDPLRTPPDPGRFDVRSNAPNQDWVDSEGASATVDWELDGAWRLRSITAYRETDTRGTVDFDLLPITVSTLLRFFQDHQATQEFQALWEGATASGVAGLFWFDGAANGQGYGNFQDRLYSLAQGGIATRSIALYGDLDWALAPRWRMEAGLRYTHERKTGTVLNGRFTDATYTQVVALTANFKDSTTFNGWSPRLAVSFSPADDRMLYAQVSRGFKGGSYNIRANTVAVPASARPIDDETVTSFELGAKTQWRDGDVTLNGAVFHNDYRDIQLSVVTDHYDADGDGQDDFPFTDFRNAGAGTIRGAELELVAHTGRHLRWLANVGYLDARYDTYIDDGVDIADTQEFTNAPMWTAGASAIAGIPLRGGSALSARIDAHYQSKSYPTTDLSEPLAQPGYTLWNAMLAWDSPDGTWRVALSAQNLSDKAYVTNGFDLRDTYDTLQRYYGAPRTTALSVTWSF